MNIIKPLAVLCLPLYLAACGSIPVFAPVHEIARPQPVIKAKPVTKLPVVKSEPEAVDSVAEAPVAVTSLLKRAQKQLRDGNEQGAAASLERAIRIAPRYPESYLRLGELRYLQGRYDQARALAEKALSLGASWMLRKQAESLVERSSSAP